jgi:hypothetical protein
MVQRMAYPTCVVVVVVGGGVIGLDSRNRACFVFVFPIIQSE